MAEGNSGAVSSVARRLESVIEDDLRSKMVLVSGPRQTGKTTLAERLATNQSSAYFNTDVAAHRKSLRENELPEDAKLWIFDELHKVRGWRRWLKGVYDLHHARHSILVTGSARLEVFKRGGDSLQGRYLGHRLHPLTFSELLGVPVADRVDDIPLLDASSPDVASSAAGTEALRSLVELGGFPEPLVRGSSRFADRWRLAYATRLVREDLRDLEAFRDLDKVEQLHDRLPALVGSPLSVNALREDLEVAFKTAEAWVTALENLYSVYRVAPFGPPRIKAVKKARKLYCWDWARVDDPGARAENLVMNHLLRLTHWLVDVHGEKADLRFFRDVLGHEVDAIVMRKGKPWMAVEIKLHDAPLDPGLRFFAERVAVPHVFQVALHGTADRFLPDAGKHGIRLVPATRFLAALP